MLTDAELKPFLLHEDQQVRLRVAEYFADGGSTDPGLLPLVLDAWERWGNATGVIAYGHHFAITGDALVRLLDLLAEAEDLNGVMHANSILERTPLELARRHRERIENTANVPVKTSERLDRRQKLLKYDADELWEELQEFGEDCAADDEDELDRTYADDLVEALAQAAAPDVETLTDLLAKEPPDISSDLELWLVGLAGARRLRAAVPALVDKLGVGGLRYVSGCAGQVLPRIGDPAAVQLIRDRFHDEDRDFRAMAAEHLCYFRHPIAEEALLALLPDETDDFIRTELCLGLCQLFSPKALEVVREAVRDGYEIIRVDLEDELLITAEVLGIDLPEAERWRAEREQRRRRRQREFDKIMGGEKFRRLVRRIAEGPEKLDEYDEPWEEPFDLDDEEPWEYTGPQHTGPDVGRNDPCPCGSGKKYKKCCGRGTGTP
jgi:hypothetical protein